ncbi:hypothetical protein CKM354_000577100 [Cercospora kikuchii]|uniref:histidine kinase n=1 Tax=Cercospora kikuchii TaxID=84275 RepID=A0A9P3CMQ6_9PEZI|nr:uncharacterized protein CKM354_000577100 [Cercospora kikuchii]GIZ42505.1 hypothetical protein CKM354_000577100 [Cercospora kikuchii]
MRISIRLQLGGLILISSLVGLAVISVAVWITIHDFVLDLRASRLALTAALKAGQLSSNLDVMQTSASFVASRVLLQTALLRYYADGNNTSENWTRARADMRAAVGGEASLGQRLLLQSRLYPRDANGVNGPYPLLNTTATSDMQRIALPYSYANGTTVYLGNNDTELSYPPMLYPNLTYLENGAAQYNDFVFTSERALLLGPWTVNATFSLLSITMPVTNNTNANDLLGYVTLVMDARLVSQVIDSAEGLGKTGETLLIGPADSTNLFPTDVHLESDIPPGLNVRYVLPLNQSYSSRHPGQTSSGTNPAFGAGDYPALSKALALTTGAGASGAELRARNEAGKKVSVGFAMPANNLVNWTILLEMSRDEVWQPIDTLRKVIVACVFATAGLMAIIAAPLAHFAAQPILRLREATLRSVDPPSTDGQSDMDSLGYLREPAADGNQDTTDMDEVIARKEGFLEKGLKSPFSRWTRRFTEDSHSKRVERRKRNFRIPGRVKQRKGCIKDELTDLTHTFNEMSDELMMQYSKLEERVRQRTAELELSKKAAEAANESKTLFIANISHELKTPLNGILGMCAVCMQEDDPLRLKRSLGIIYKSGDLLLNLLTDLLTFSKNQVGQHLTLDEKEFRLRDVSSQILAIFEKQAKEGQIDLKVQFEGIYDTEHDIAAPDQLSGCGPGASGRMRDMILWGDIHRILQVVINLVSNSLKFTPAGGTVALTIRALPELLDIGSRQTSVNSRQSLQIPRKRDSDLSIAKIGTQRNSDASMQRFGTANAINVLDKPHAIVHVAERARSPASKKYICFEFEVTDTGPGIPQDLQDKIFEPFVQGDLGLSKKYGGTGLGLSICSQLASLMRGSMSVHSEVGSGSTFTMKIPLRHVQTRADSAASSALGHGEEVCGASSFDAGSRSASPQRSHGSVDYDPEASSVNETTKPMAHPAGDISAQSQPRLVGLSQPFFASNKTLDDTDAQGEAMRRMSASASRTGRIRVLVAEDNKVNQEVVLRMLKLEDIYDVVVAKDGQEALDLVKESMCPGSQPFNLIFMDVQMPNVDGLTSTRLIRQIGYQEPIVALTAYAEENNIKDCMDSGMNYFLSKPIRRPQLKKVLNEYITPIPEEPEEQLTPPEERRGSHNTTIVMVNNGRNSQEFTTHDGTTEPANGTFDITGRSFQASAVSRHAQDDRSASPRTVM